jgi:hypothetical protein
VTAGQTMRRLSPLALALALGASPLGLITGPDRGPDGAAFAQTPRGTQLSATISQRFEIDSNIDLQDPSPGTSAFGETRLALGLLEESPVQRFQLGLDTGLRAITRPDEDFEFTFASPSTATAGYALEWASGSLSADLRYRQRRVDFTRDIFVDDEGVVVPDDPAETVEEEALERRYDASFGLALATDRRSSYAFTLAATRIDFSEDAGDLTPRDTIEGRATWQLQLTPVFAGTISARGFRYEADNDAETRITENELDAGLVYEPSAILRLTAGAGYFTRERRDFGATVEDTSGVAVRGGLRYIVDDFTVNAGIRLASAPGTRVSGNVALTYPLPNGRVTARVFQSFAGGAGGDEIRVTGAGFGLLHDLDAVSRVNFDVAASRRVNVDDPGDDPVTRLDVTTSLGYDLTETISADIGYRYRLRDEGPSTADSHAVFVQIGRTFVTGF